MIRSLNLGRLEQAVNDVLNDPSDSLRDQLLGIADAQGVKL
jgi:hypothetical protein